MTTDRTRRSVLGTVGALSVATLAGCSEEWLPDEESNPDIEQGYAAFFPLWDWAQEISGDQVTFENPVGVGRIGHGWEPPSGLVRDIAATDVFIYLDSPEFSWAQNVAETLEADYDDITVIDGMTELDEYLRPFHHDHDHSHSDEDHEDDHHDDHDHDHSHSDEDHEDDHHDDHDHDHDDHGNVTDLYIIHRETDQIIADHHDAHWHGGLPEVAVGETVSIGARFEDGGDELPLGSDAEYQFSIAPDPHDEGHVAVDSHGDHVHIHGQEPGTASVTIQLLHDDHVEWESAPISITVVEEHDDDISVEFADPHVWVDPVIAQEIVQTIADELGAADPDYADQYASNADAYIEELERIDQEFASMVDAAPLDIVVLAGHDSFGYIEDRYGFEIHSPQGLSPDVSVAPAEIADTIDLIEEHAIDTILYDPFEADTGIPSLAETIQENAPTVTEALPVTPIEGTTEEWYDLGWGWIEQMEEVNIPAFSQALGIE